MFNSSRSKYEHMLTLGAPILVSLIVGILAMIAVRTREIAGPLLVLFIIFCIGQCIGLFLIFLSKFSNIKKGIYFNFGFAGLGRRERFLYVLGYTILIATTVFEITYVIRMG